MQAADSAAKEIRCCVGPGSLALMRVVPLPGLYQQNQKTK
jgi:hypothetical protein